LFVCETPAPGPYVREMTDAGMFYLNRVLKEFKEKYVVFDGQSYSLASSISEHLPHHGMNFGEMV